MYEILSESLPIQILPIITPHEHLKWKYNT